MTPPFAFLDNAREAVAEFVNNCLLVAGGFLVGYILGGLVGWALGKWVLRQQKPEAMKQLGRPIGGAILALIIALLVFTGRGKRLGDGGDGKGAPDTAANKEDSKSPEPSPKIEPKVTLPKTDLKPADLVIPITIVEGADVPAPGKFYRVESGPALTLDELKAEVNARKAKEKGKVALAIRYQKNAPPGDPRLVTNLTHWAYEEAGLDVTFPANK